MLQHSHWSTMLLQIQLRFCAIWYSLAKVCLNILLCLIRNYQNGLGDGSIIMTLKNFGACQAVQIRLRWELISNQERCRTRSRKLRRRKTPLYIRILPKSVIHSNMPERKDIVGEAWDCKEVDWNEYESHRSPYTKALYDLIFQHHETNNGRYESALDVGAEGGTVTKVLLERFKHVIFSDPSEEYITRAQKCFKKQLDSGSMTFLQRKFDQFTLEDIPNETPVDMITAGTCIHFSDPALLTTQLAPLLRSGGTFAAFSYGSIPITPVDHPRGRSRWSHDKDMQRENHALDSREYLSSEQGFRDWHRASTI